MAPKKIRDPIGRCFRFRATVYTQAHPTYGGLRSGQPKTRHSWAHLAPPISWVNEKQLRETLSQGEIQKWRLDIEGDFTKIGIAPDQSPPSTAVTVAKSGVQLRTGVAKMTDDARRDAISGRYRFFSSYRFLKLPEPQIVVSTRYKGQSTLALWNSLSPVSTVQPNNPPSTLCCSAQTCFSHPTTRPWAFCRYCRRLPRW